MSTFSTVLSALKLKDQTRQNLVLTALYSLNAAQVPTPAKALTELFKLHLPKKRRPQNVNDCLRKSAMFVEPAAKGPPLLWRLKAAGIARLRAVSGLPLTTASAETDFESDIGIVCALEQPEFEAVKQAFGSSALWSEIGETRYTHIYRETFLHTKLGKKLRIVATTSTSMGLTAAAIAATQLILKFRPRLVAMIGIAAGTRSGDKQFGDVLVADPSVDYNSGKVIENKGIREFLPDPYPIGLNARLRSVLQKYATDPGVFESIRARWKHITPNKANRLHIGPLGAADQVIDDPTRVLEITKNWRKLVGVEMETYAVYRACHESPEPKPRVVSFKSVCDFAAEKTDSWQAYAAFMASHFAVDFFKAEWEALWPLEIQKDKP